MQLVFHALYYLTLGLSCDYKASMLALMYTNAYQDNVIVSIIASLFSVEGVSVAVGYCLYLLASTLFTSLYDKIRETIPAKQKKSSSSEEESKECTETTIADESDEETAS